MYLKLVRNAKGASVFKDGQIFLLDKNVSADSNLEGEFMITGQIEKRVENGQPRKNSNLWIVTPVTEDSILIKHHGFQRNGKSFPVAVLEENGGFVVSNRNLARKLKITKDAILNDKDGLVTTNPGSCYVSKSDKSFLGVPDLDQINPNIIIKPSSKPNKIFIRLTTLVDIFWNGKYNNDSAFLVKPTLNTKNLALFKDLNNYYFKFTINDVENNKIVFNPLHVDKAKNFAGSNFLGMRQNENTLEKFFSNRGLNAKIHFLYE